MADSYALALQRGVVAALKAAPGVAALVGAKVYDEPPQGAAHPFVRLGEIAPRPLRTDGKRAATVPFGIEVHSRPVAGRVEATRISEAVVAALDANEAAVTVTGFALVQLYWLTTTVDRAADGQSYIAIAAFEALLDG